MIKPMILLKKWPRWGFKNSLWAWNKRGIGNRADYPMTSWKKLCYFDCSFSKNRSNGDQQMSGKLLVAGIVIFFLLFFAYESWLMRSLPHWQTIESRRETSEDHRIANWTYRSVSLLAFLASGGVWKLAINPSRKNINYYKHRRIDDPHIV